MQRIWQTGDWRRLRVMLLLACAMLLTGAVARADTPVLVDTRMGLKDEKTRFVLEFQQAVPYQIFTLTSPDRVVIELPALDWQGPRPERVTPRGVISGFRHGLFRPGVARVVLDLTAPARIHRSFALDAGGQYGPRVVIDLQPALETPRLAQPIQAAGWADYEAQLARASPAITPVGPPPGSTKRIVVLDPGHGGIDPGAIGTTGVYEKTVVLAYAKVLRDVLQATGRYNVVLTRDRDIFIPLRDRYEVAHRVDAGLFVSVHADSHRNRSLRGLSVYTLSDKASDAEAAALATKENQSDILAGTDLTGYEPDVTSILISLAQQSVMQSSSVFAETLVAQMQPTVNLLRNPHRYAGFAVLKSPNVPSVLVELGYLSNRKDEALLGNPKHHRNLAAAMLRAIDHYFEERERLERS